MIDLRGRFAELDLLDAPDLRERIDRQVAELPVATRLHEPMTVRVRAGWRGPVIAVATAVVILAVVAVAALVLRSDAAEVTDPTVPSTVTTTAPTTTAATTPTVSDAPSTMRHAGDAAAIGWQSFEFPHGPPIGRLANGSFVALDEWGDRSSAARVSVSTDGSEWVSHDIDEFADRRVYYGYPVLGMNTHAGLLWAWVSEPGEVWPLHAWISEDGISWRQVKWPTSTETRATYWPFPTQASRLGDVLFLSTDTPEQHFVSQDAGRSFTDVAPFPDGKRAVLHWSTGERIQAFVLVGNSPHRFLGTDMELWESLDGATWVRRGDVRGLEGTLFEIFLPQRAVITPDAIILSTSDPMSDNCDPVFVRSEDGGLSWELLDVLGELPLDRQEPPFIDPGPCDRVAAVMDGWLMAQTNGMVWVSRNGIDWYTLNGRINRSYHRVSTDDGWAVPPP